MDKNVLKDARLYLSGPMDKANDHGISWRRDFIERSKFLNMAIMDPTNKPMPLASEVGEEKQAIVGYRERGEWDKLCKFVKQFRRSDLRMTDLADILVVYIDPDIPSWGTPDEVFTAERQKKPLLCIVKGGKKALPTWCFAVFEMNEVFETVDECIEYLTRIDCGEIAIDDRWVLIGKYLKTS